MNKFCFLLSFDNRADNYYFNQVVLLIHSVRAVQNPIFNQSHFFISINDKKTTKEQILILKRLNNVTIYENNFTEFNWSTQNEVKKTHKRGHPDTDDGINLCRKYSIFKYFDKQDNFDKFIFLDSDFIFSDGIFATLNDLNKDAILIPSGKAAQISNYKNILHNHFKIPLEALQVKSNQWSKMVTSNHNHSSLPHFFTGFFILNCFGLNVLKKHIFKTLHFYYELSCKNSLQTAKWNFEQTAFSTLIIKNNLCFDICPVSIFGPEMFHLFKTIYGVDHYLNKNISDYKKSDCDAKKLIYKLSINLNSF